jgi:hypothetical protein
MSATLTTAVSSSSLKVLSSASIELLRARGEAQLSQGYRAVSNTSYSTANSLDSEATVFIPDELDSFETLHFLELNDATAAIVWQQFLARRAEFPDRANILNSAKRHLASIQADAVTADDDWVGVMRQIGMSSNFQARIMGGDQEMRLSGSLKEWITEMMNIRYDFLKGLDHIIQTPPTSVLARKSSRPTMDGSFSIQAAPAIPARVSSQFGKAPPARSFTAPDPAVATVTENAPRQLDGHVMLLKGAVAPRLDKLFKKNGELNFRTIASTAPEDFSKGFNGLYFTKQYEVAWRYAKWAQTIVDGNVVPVEILHVAVPKELTTSSKELFGEDWRRLVWGCRRKSEEVPKDLICLKEFHWLIGGICRSPMAQVEKMTTSAELQMWKLADNQAKSQYYGGNDVIIQLMNEHCVGKVWRTAVHVEETGIRTEYIEERHTD